jgi:RNA polymerase sigma-70 factor, ECF subfamily
MPDHSSRLLHAHGTSWSTSVDYSTIRVAELIEACTKGESAAWQEFMRRFNRIIAITAARTARRWGEISPQAIDDLVQDTYLKLCAHRGRVLREFQFEHEDAIFGFLKVVTANLVNDRFKELRTEKRGGNRSSGPLEGKDNHGGAAGPAGLAAPESALLMDEVDACICANVPSETKSRDRAIFWLYYRQGMTAKEITGLPGIGLSLKGVESTLHRLIHLVRTHLVEAAPRRAPGPRWHSGWRNPTSSR